MKIQVPLGKQTKKRQKAHHSLKRGTWGDVVPTTRVVPSGKTYRRQERKRMERKALRSEE